MNITYERDGGVIVESDKAILNVKYMSDGTDRLEGVFDLDNRRYYMFTEEELGRDVFNGKNAVALTIDEWANNKYQDIARYCDTDISAITEVTSRIYAEALHGLTPTGFTTKIDYAQFSKALETMPDFLKRPYNKNDNMKETFKMEYKYHRIPKIKNVIIAEPYTTILWSDNTKTQVKCMDGDRFDPEHGFAMCVLKKIYEEPKKPNAYSKWLKGWVKKGVENGEKQKKKKQKKEKEECKKDIENRENKKEKKHKKDLSSLNWEK